MCSMGYVVLYYLKGCPGSGGVVRPTQKPIDLIDPIKNKNGLLSALMQNNFKR